MRYSPFLIFLILLVSCVKPVQKEEAFTEQDTLVARQASDSLAFWAPELFEKDPNLADLCERLWQSSILGEDEHLHDLQQQGAWYKSHEKAMLDAFDRLYPKSGLDTIQRIDSLMRVLEYFVEDEPDMSTMGMIVYNDIVKHILMYNEAAYQYHLRRYFGNEIKLWNELEQALFKYGIADAEIEWYGGTGRAPAIGFYLYDIINIRLEDLRSIYARHKSGGKGIEDIDGDMIDREVEICIDFLGKHEGEVLSYIPIILEEYEDDRSEYLSQFAQTLKDSRKNLEVSLKDWVEIRLSKDRLSVSKMIEKLMYEIECIAQG